MRHGQGRPPRFKAARRVAGFVLYKDAGPLASGRGLPNEPAEARKLPQRRFPDLEVRLDPTHCVQVVRRAAHQSLVVEGHAALPLELRIVQSKRSLHDGAPARHDLAIGSSAERHQTGPVERRRFMALPTCSSSGDGSPKLAGFLGSTLRSLPVTSRSA